MQPYFLLYTLLCVRHAAHSTLYVALHEARSTLYFDVLCVRCTTFYLTVLCVSQASPGLHIIPYNALRVARGSALSFIVLKCT